MACGGARRRARTFVKQRAGKQIDIICCGSTVRQPVLIRHPTLYTNIGLSLINSLLHGHDSSFESSVHARFRDQHLHGGAQREMGDHHYLLPLPCHQPMPHHAWLCPPCLDRKWGTLPWSCIDPIDPGQTQVRPIQGQTRGHKVKGSEFNPTNTGRGS